MNRWYVVTMHHPRDENKQKGFTYILDPGETSQHWDKRNRFWMEVLAHELRTNGLFGRVHIKPQKKFTVMECIIFCSERQYHKLIREIINLRLDEMIFINRKE